LLTVFLSVMTKLRDMYFSVDIETDGPLVGINSMLSLGSTALDDDGKEISTFSMNLKELDGAVQDEDTMRWWSGRPKALAAARKDPRSPKEVMHAFVVWVKGISEPRNSKPILLAYPTVFDYGFIRWYLIRFTGSDIFDLNSIDLRSYAMGTSGKNYFDSKVDFINNHKKKELSHIALVDARDQASAFVDLYTTANPNLPRYHRRA
jgi:hypothetical protein